MKRIIGIAICALFFLGSSNVFAQDTKTKKDTGSIGQKVKAAGKSTGKAIGKGAKAVGKGAKKVGKKSAEVGAKGAAKITDKSLKDRKGPNGETVYVNKYDQKYYVDRNGRRVYLDD